MKKLIEAITIALVCIVPLAGCEKQGPMERAGESIDEATEDVGDSIEEASEDMDDALHK